MTALPESDQTRVHEPSVAKELGKAREDLATLSKELERLEHRVGKLIAEGEQPAAGDATTGNERPRVKQPPFYCADCDMIILETAERVFCSDCWDEREVPKPAQPERTLKEGYHIRKEPLYGEPTVYDDGAEGTWMAVGLVGSEEVERCYEDPELTDEDIAWMKERGATCGECVQIPCTCPVDEPQADAPGGEMPKCDFCDKRCRDGHVTCEAVMCHKCEDRWDRTREAAKEDGHEQERAR